MALDLPFPLSTTSVLSQRRHSHVHRDCADCDPMVAHPRAHVYRDWGTSVIVHVLSESMPGRFHSLQVWSTTGEIRCSCTNGYYQSSRGQAAKCLYHLHQCLTVPLDTRLRVIVAARIKAVEKERDAREALRLRGYDPQDAITEDVSGYDFDTAPLLTDG